MSLTKQMANTYSKNILFLRILHIFFITAGILFIVILIIAFTTLPFWGIYWLGTSKSELRGAPHTIVLLGGSGMPSESNLIRAWYASEAAKNFPQSAVLIAMPGDTTDVNSTPMRMKDELVLRGVEASRIKFESEGTNTRSQALFASGLLNKTSRLLLITSPDHTRRAVLCFEKVGFQHVDAMPAFENPTEADLFFEDRNLGGRKTIVPTIGNNLPVRYQVWNHLKYEVSFLREITALAYYKLKGWT